MLWRLGRIVSGITGKSTWMVIQMDTRDHSSILTYFKTLGESLLYMAQNNPDVILPDRRPDGSGYEDWSGYHH